MASVSIGRVKKIIQSDPDVGKVSREALIAISKASVREPHMHACLS